MTDTQIAIKIGFFEMKPETDICKDCPRCDLEIQTRKYFYVGESKASEVRGVCTHADACRGVYEHCLRMSEKEKT